MKYLYLIVVLTLLTSCKSTAPKPKPCDRSVIKVSFGNHYDIDCIDRVRVNRVQEV